MLNLENGKCEDDEVSQKEREYRKVILSLAVIFIAVSVAFFVFLKKREIASTPYHFEKNKVVAKGYDHSIEHLEESPDEIALSGWVIRKGTKIDTIERYVIFKEKDGKTSRLLATEIIPREDLKTYGDDGLDYTYSGFYARIDKSELEDRKTYELYLLDEVNDLSVLVPLNKTIKEGQIK